MLEKLTRELCFDGARERESGRVLAKSVRRQKQVLHTTTNESEQLCRVFCFGSHERANRERERERAIKEDTRLR